MMAHYTVVKLKLHDPEMAALQEFANGGPADDTILDIVAQLVDAAGINRTAEWMPARDLKRGMRVDLEGDQYALMCSSPDCDEEHGLQWEYEYGAVWTVEYHERDQIAVVTFEQEDQIAFPADHMLRVAWMEEEEGETR